MTTRVTDFELLIDDRERAVYPHLETEARDITYTKMRFEIGDYALRYLPTNQIIAVFERKTLKDFADSLIDGRYANKDKMIKFREQTGCRVILIVEGPPHPGPREYFGSKMYYEIESAIFHMQMRDNIHVINTLNQAHTIVVLVRYIKSMVTLVCKTPISKFIGGTIESKKESPELTSPCVDLSPRVDLSPPKVSSSVINLPPIADQQPIDQPRIAEGKQEVDDDVRHIDTAPPISMPQVTPMVDQMVMLTTKVQKTDLEVVRELWATFTNINIISADAYIIWRPIKDIFDVKARDTVRRELENMRTSRGTKLDKRVIASLTQISYANELRTLSAMPGLSRKTATDLLTGRSLGDIFAMSAATLGAIKVGAKARALGEKKAAKIIALGNFCMKKD
jgi:ERCC4-type nuclease